jgi:signal peptidase I
VRSPRAGAVTALLALLLATAWIVAGPERLGGSTTYVTTHGTSMEPRFHTGDLALVRAAGRYDVGDVVAYRSATLHRVVLHRVIGRRGDRYVVKGDHNSFVDPERPLRNQLIGRLWVRVPHGGAVLGLLQSPLVAALLCGGVGLLLVAPARRRRGRRRRSRASGGGGMKAPRAARVPVDPDARAILTGCAVLAGVCLLVGLLAWTRPAARTGTEKVAYTQKVRFSYRADVPGGAVYPDGVVRTGDPIFLKLVDAVDVKVAYRLDSAAPALLKGTQEVRVRLTSPSGWSRTLRLAPATAFSGTRATATVRLDLARLQDLIRRVAALTGTPSGVPFTVAVLPVVHVKGTVGGAPLKAGYAPALSFQLDPLQLRVGTGATAVTAAAGAAGDKADGGGFAPSSTASVAAASETPNHLHLLGGSIAVDPARWLALVGLLAAAGLAVLTLAHQRRRPTDPYTVIRARYGHLIVPIASYVHDPAQPVVDVTSIDALAQVAIRGERVILHHHRVGAETYLVDDDGTLFRFQPRPHRLPGAVAAAAAAA